MDALILAAALSLGSTALSPPPEESFLLTIENRTDLQLSLELRDCGREDGLRPPTFFGRGWSDMVLDRGAARQISLHAPESWHAPTVCVSLVVTPPTCDDGTSWPRHTRQLHIGLVRDGYGSIRQLRPRSRRIVLTDADFVGVAGSLLPGPSLVPCNQPDPVPRPGALAVDLSGVWTCGDRMLHLRQGRGADGELLQSIEGVLDRTRPGARQTDVQPVTAWIVGGGRWDLIATIGRTAPHPSGVIGFVIEDSGRELLGIASAYIEDEGSGFWTNQPLSCHATGEPSSILPADEAPEAIRPADPAPCPAEPVGRPHLLTHVVNQSPVYWFRHEGGYSCGYLSSAMRTQWMLREESNGYVLYDTSDGMPVRAWRFERDPDYRPTVTFTEGGPGWKLLPSGRRDPRGNSNTWQGRPPRNWQRR